MKRFISCLLLFAICFCGLGGIAHSAAYSDVESAGKKGVSGLYALAGISQKRALLQQEEALPVGQSTSDWTAMALAVRGVPEAYDWYLERLSQLVTENYKTKGGLDSIRATQWHRIALTVLALGGDPTAFGEHTDGTPINLVADGVYNYINETLDAQGLNGLLYGLLLLDAKDYTVPEGSRYTREDILQMILDRQNEDGGFGLAVGTSDIDISAMALQALAPYKDGIAAQAVQSCLSYLSAMQAPNGSFPVKGSSSLESIAQVVLALCALGLDPAATPEFCKAEGNTLNALLSYQQEDGSFAHIPGGEGDFIATEQALLALSAVEKQRSIFDFTDYTPPAEREKKPYFPLWVWPASGGILLCGIAAFCAVSKKKRVRSKGVE